MKKNRTILIVASTILVLILLMILLIINSTPNYTLIPAIINSDSTEFKIKETSSTVSLSRGSKINILKENNDNFLIEYENKQGYIAKDKVTHFQFNSKEDYSLVLDVSKFNISNKSLTDYVDFAKFIVDNKINYTYIRLCR